MKRTVTDFIEVKEKGHRYILAKTDRQKCMPEANFLLGMALVAELKEGDTLEAFLCRQAERQPVKLNVGRPKVANPKVYVPKGDPRGRKKSENPKVYIPTGNPKGRPKKNTDNATQAD